MGLDINLYAQGNFDDDQLAAANSFLAEREIAERVGRPGYFRDRAELATLGRYYGPGCERGDWPRIHTLIMAMRGAFPGCTVHYGSDAEEDCPEADDDALREMWAYWSGPNWDAYWKRRQRRASVNYTAVIRLW